jgi:hypothetical protein
MSGRNEVVDTILKELEQHGLKPVLLNGGKHHKIRWVGPQGERTFVTSVSPSDVRTKLNARAQVRRMLRDDGVALRVEPKPSILEKAMAVQPAPDPLGVRVAKLEAELNALTEMFLEQYAEHDPVIELAVKGATVRLRPEAPKTPETKPSRWDPAGRVPVHAPSRKRGAVQSAILGVMSFNEVSRAAELSRYVGRSPNHVTATLYNLQKKGLVEKLGRGEWRKLPQRP